MKLIKRQWLFKFIQIPHQPPRPTWLEAACGSEGKGLKLQDLQDTESPIFCGGQLGDTIGKRTCYSSEEDLGIYERIKQQMILGVLHFVPQHAI